MAYGGEIISKKLNFNVMVYNENDLKGQPLQQSLTTENIEALT